MKESDYLMAYGNNYNNGNGNGGYNRNNNGGNNGGYNRGNGNGNGRQDFNLVKNFGLRCHSAKDLQNGKGVALNCTMNGKRNKDGSYGKSLSIAVFAYFDTCQMPQADYNNANINVDGQFSINDYVPKNGNGEPIASPFIRASRISLSDRQPAQNNNGGNRNGGNGGYNNGGNNYNNNNGGYNGGNNGGYNGNGYNNGGNGYNNNGNNGGYNGNNGGYDDFGGGFDEPNFG